MSGHYIVEINYKCNANCCFCANSKGYRSQPDLNYDKLIQDLKENRKKFDSLIISGGEPTIYPHILKYIKYAKNVCRYKRIAIATNGFMLFYDDFVDELIKSGVDSFQVPFQTTDKKVYNKITGVKGSYEYVTNGIKNIKDREKYVNNSTVLHKLNYESIQETVAFLINMGVDYIQLAFMNPIGSSVINGKSVMAVTYTELMPYIKSAFKKAEEMNFNNLFIENIPICVAEEFINKISDLRKPEENKDYYNACKTKPEKCKKCFYFNICDGVWEEYLKQFGDQEIRPVEKETPKIENKNL